MNEVQNSMVARVQQYVRFKQDLGYSLTGTAGELMRFARFADESGHQGPLTISLILRWAQSVSKSTRIYRARRVEIARTFARFEASFDPRTQMPPRRILGPAHRRIQPYIYTEEEVASLMQAAATLTPSGGLRPHTYSVLVGLLASTGLRLSEALQLDRTAFDAAAGQLRVEETKFRKCRIVPVDSSVSNALVRYTRFRDQYRPNPESQRLLLSEQGRDLLPSVVHYTFQKLRTETGIIGLPGDRAPRMHDLRHTFACNVLRKWYAEGADVNHLLPFLSTYLGHAKPSDTYWYITAVPELLNLALARFPDTGASTGGDV